VARNLLRLINSLEILSQLVFGLESNYYFDL
jgi:hypothetical protein